MTTDTILLKEPKRKKKPDSPSPSGDPWYDDPRNIAIVEEAIQSAKEGKGERIVLSSKEEIREFLANL